MSFAGKRRTKLDKNISKHLSSKCIQKLLDYAKQSATDAVKAETVQKEDIGFDRELLIERTYL